MMSDQSIINAILGLVNVLFGLFLKVAWDSLRALHAADKEISEKVSQIEVLVAGQYVHRNEFQKMVDALFAKLDKIDDKLDGKADR